MAPRSSLPSSVQERLDDSHALIAAGVALSPGQPIDEGEGNVGLVGTVHSYAREIQSAVDSLNKWKGLQPGQQLGNWLVIEKIGEGNYAEVWRAQDLKLESQCALKVFRPVEFARSRWRHAVERFCKGALALAKLKDVPNVVGLRSSLYFEDAYVWFCMDLCDSDLAKGLKTGTLTCQEGLQIFEQVLAATAEAHRRDVRHRDIRPQNILWVRSADGAVHGSLTDFDIAYWEQFIFDGYRTVMVEGNRRYLPGELLSMPAEHKDFTDHVRSTYIDVYALGVVLLDVVLGPVVVAASSYEDFDALIAARGEIPTLLRRRSAAVLARTFNGYGRSPNDARELSAVWRAEPPPTLAEKQAEEKRIEAARLAQVTAARHRRIAIAVAALLLLAVVAIAAVLRSSVSADQTAAGNEGGDAARSDGGSVAWETRLSDAAVVSSLPASRPGLTEEAIWATIVTPDMRRVDQFERLAGQLFQAMPVKRDREARLMTRLLGPIYEDVSRLQSELRLIAYGAGAARLDPYELCQYRVLFGHASVAIMRCQDGLPALQACSRNGSHSNLDVWIADVLRCLGTDDGFVAAMASYRQTAMDGGQRMDPNSYPDLAAALVWLATSENPTLIRRLMTWRAAKMLDEIGIGWSGRRAEVYLRMPELVTDCSVRQELEYVAKLQLEKADSEELERRLAATRLRCPR